ncbi:MAG TPA: NAD(P)-binding domain-containing protein [Polyangia bacterium]|nr:NAD(P)-binding domain-containing protein [Polyangia bacterium]
MESLIAIGGLIGFAVFCVLVSAGVGALRARLRRKPQPKKLLVHAINDDRCTGCDACVTVCPTDVLELIDNKSRVQRMDDCIQCEQCAIVCPTTALVMHYQGTQPPAFRMPKLDDYYQAAQGLYLIGEAGGKPLVKNASNLGRAVVEHMLKNGLKPRRPEGGRIVDVDVMIVGSGPGGLSAALSCIQHGLTYALLEKDELVASTIARWPKGKECMAEPYDVKCVGLLPVFDAKKDELIAAWRTILDRHDVRVSTRESVEDIKRLDGSRFEIRSTRKLYRAQRVVLSIGTRGKPRRLGVPGENLPKVSALLGDAAEHRGQRVMVVGGGDSAVEAAIALADTAARVILSYRGKALSRCKAANRARLDELVRTGRITLRFSTNVVEVRPESVMLKSGEKVEELDNDHLFVCIGGDAPVKWLESVGVRFTERPHMHQMGPTDRLVEALIGPQHETSREAAGGGAPDAVMVDPTELDVSERHTVVRFPVERVRRIA